MGAGGRGRGGDGDNGGGVGRRDSNQAVAVLWSLMSRIDTAFLELRNDLRNDLTALEGCHSAAQREAEERWAAAQLASGERLAAAQLASEERWAAAQLASEERWAAVQRKMEDRLAAAQQAAEGRLEAAKQAAEVRLSHDLHDLANRLQQQPKVSPRDIVRPYALRRGSLTKLPTSPAVQDFTEALKNSGK